jgi:peptidoglycan/xylan/chitin deacetylase (PgdA/CDA1 family)
MLKAVVERGRTIRYQEIDSYQDFVLWRHDCDMSLNRARRIAELDAEYGVKSTFFILPHSDFYNILEISQTKLIREIALLGHDIGLHLDIGYHYEASETFDIDKAITKDQKILEDIAEVGIKAFSLHNPTPQTLKFDHETYAGLINCYSKKIWANISYCSDSNGYWRHEPIPEVLKNSSQPKLQILKRNEFFQSYNLKPHNSKV